MGNVRVADLVSDPDIQRLNHIGLGLKAIAEELGCHAATITTRLKAMNLQPTDTRRSFMEQVYKSLSKDQKEWLTHNLYTKEIDVRKFITTLIKDAYASSDTTGAVEHTPAPELESGTRKKKKKDTKEIEPVVVGPRLIETEDASDEPLVVVPEKPKKLFTK